MNERRIASGKQPDGVARVEESLSTGIYARRKRGITVRRIVARIVEKHDPASRENSRRSRLDEPRIEVAGTCRQHFQRPTVRILERGPVQQIVPRRAEDVRHVLVHAHPSVCHGLPSGGVCTPVFPSPEASSARYTTYTAPPRTTAAGLKVAYASHRTMLSLIADRTVLPALGAKIGFTLGGLMNGPSIHDGCAHAGCAAHATTAATSSECLRTFTLGRRKWMSGLHCSNTTPHPNQTRWR